MKKVSRSLFAIIIILTYLIGCNNKDKGIKHVGKVNLSSSIKIDSIVIDAPYSSGEGNFYMRDSVITFADSHCVTLFCYSAKTGKLISKHFRKGNGPNEMPYLEDVYPESNGDRSFVYDGSGRVLIFDKSYVLSKSKWLDFGWKNNVKHSSDFETPSNYNMMGMAPFNTNYTRINDSIVMFPADVINRKTSQNGFINSKRYEEGHIFGLLNVNSMKVKKVFGKFPSVYKTNPVPHFENFHYSMFNNKIYVNHVIDSLIYVYKYPEKLLYTFGYECKNINRNYTVTKRIGTDEFFEKDSKKCGLNTGLKYIPETDILIRTYILNFNNGESGLQIYKDNNLTGDFEVPPYFLFLGYYDDFYYGVRLLPIETDDTTKFVIYKFQILKDI